MEAPGTKWCWLPLQLKGVFVSSSPKPSISVSQSFLGSVEWLYAQVDAECVSSLKEMSVYLGGLAATMWGVSVSLSLRHHRCVSSNAAFYRSKHTDRYRTLSELEPRWT